MKTAIFSFTSLLNGRLDVKQYSKCACAEAFWELQVLGFTSFSFIYPNLLTQNFLSLLDIHIFGGLAIRKL